MANKVHVGDIGTKFLVTITDGGVVIRSAGSGTNINTIIAPGAFTDAKAGDIVTNHTRNGAISYLTVVTDPNTATIDPPITGQNVGDAIDLKFVVDISSASTPADRKIYFKGPWKDSVAKTMQGEFETDGTNGQMQFTSSQATDVDEAGQWSIQGYVNVTAGTWKTEVKTFDVFENLA